MAGFRAKLLGLAACVFALSACEDGSYSSGGTGENASPGEMAEYMAEDRFVVTGSRMSRGDAMPPPSPLDGEVDGTGSEAQLYLAYRFNTGLVLPAEQLAQTHNTHADACFEAGPDVCQVVQASVNNPEGPRPSAYLELRAAPAWIVAFRDTLSAELEEAGGRISSDQTSIEDLTARIVDAEARLQARITLRDRLQTLLETRDGELDELLQVERELARVQEQLDAQASVLAVLRQRVNTSTLSLSYEAEREIVQREQFNPIVRALSDMGDVFSRALADVIRFIAGFLPWLIVIIPAGWLIRRFVGGWLRRRREAKAS